MRKGLFIIFFVLANDVLATTPEEHRFIPRDALKSGLHGCREKMSESLRQIFIRDDSLDIDAPLWQSRSFSDISVLYAGDDLSYARNQEYRKSILQQLQSLPAELIDICWSTVEAGQFRWLEQKNKNAVVNYLLHHLIALRFADRAGSETEGDGENLKTAFSYEAIAQSYLVDLFSSSHMLVSHLPLAFLQPFNYRHAHDFFKTKGAFVINSEGDVWQTFGDRLMLWYEPSYRFTVNACTASINELLLVYYTSADTEELPQSLDALRRQLDDPESIGEWIKSKTGTEYYRTDRMPTLMSLPVPVSASWSRMTDVMNEHGIHSRFHYPQLSEPGLHDPDMDGIDPSFLFSMEQVPDWLVVPELSAFPHPDSAKKLIQCNDDFASVRYVQQRYFPPSYLGFLIHSAGGMSFKNSGELIYGLGFGFGLLNDLLFLHNFSVDVQVDRIDDRTIFTPKFGGGVQPPFARHLTFMKSLRMEIGHPFERNVKSRRSHHSLCFGIEFASLPLSFTYAGITPRIMYQRISSRSIHNAIYLQLTIH